MLEYLCRMPIPCIFASTFQGPDFLCAAVVQRVPPRPRQVPSQSTPSRAVLGKRQRSGGEAESMGSGNSKDTKERGRTVRRTPIAEEGSENSSGELHPAASDAAGILLSLGGFGGSSSGGR